MKPGVTLETERLVIRHWARSGEDRAFFHLIMSNERGRRFYPDRKTREESDDLIEKIIGWQDDGELTWAVACRKDTGQRLGFTGLAPVTLDMPFAPTVEIGWQYDPAVWGNGYATEAGAELLRHAFETLDIPEIVAFAVEDNTASTAIMARIGMRHCPDETFIHPKVPDTHQQLKRHVLWRITADEWKRKPLTFAGGVRKLSRN
ncbi:MAG: GNAT family N-acetyltransferase [Rhizobiaceae bacterium]